MKPTQETEPPNVPPNSRDRARRQRWVLIITFILLGILGAVTWRFWLTARREAMIQAIRAAGVPASLNDLNKSLGEMPPDADNAGPLYQRAFGLIDREFDDFYGPLTPIARGFEDPREDEPYPDPVMDEAVRYLERHAPALALLDQADALPRSRLMREVTPDFAVFELGQFRHAARVRLMQARVGAELGDPEAVVHGLLGAVKLGERMGEEPQFLIVHLVRIAMLSSTVNALERTVNLIDLNDAQLARLSAELTREERGGNALYRPIVSERVYGIESFPRIIDMSGPSYPYAIFSSNTPGRLAALGYYVSGLYELDYAFYLEYMSRAVEASKTPLPRRLEVIEGVEQFFEESTTGASRFGKSITATLGFSMGRAFVLDARTVAQVRVATAALAVQRHRLTVRGLPDSLDSLVPRFLDAVPVDPFTGSPVVYKELAEGFVVYSVGEDKADDGGAKVNTLGMRFEPGSDVPFQVRR